jgi:hypothetical protein
MGEPTIDEPGVDEAVDGDGNHGCFGVDRTDGMGDIFLLVPSRQDATPIAVDHRGNRARGRG